MTRRAFGLAIVLLAMLGALVAACSSQPTRSAPVSTPALAPPPTAGPDACAPANMRTTAGVVNNFMRRFDDESALAANVPRSQLADHIAALQSIRREAQTQSAPECVVQLKQLELTHMNTVIDTMLGFMGRGDQAEVTKGIALGRQQHDQYVLELARLLGITAVAVTPVAAQTLAAPSEAAPTAGTQSLPAPSGFVVVNAGPVPLTLRAVPATAGDMVATLPMGQSAVALGGSSDGQWIQVVVPDHPYQTAWVLASLVQIALPTP